MHKLVEFFSSPTVNFLLKLLTGVAAAGFGILGVWAETRYKDGRFNAKGRIALIGILIAGFLAVGTSISEWLSTKAKDQAGQESNRKLVRSVEKGSYPFNHIAGELRISLTGDVPGLHSYEDMLRRTLPNVSNNQCVSTKAYLCGGDDDGISIYAIPKGSTLYPRPTSALGIILDNLEVSVDLASRSAGPADTNYRNLGGFSFSIRDLSPKSTTITYDRKSDEFIYELDDFEIPDSRLLISGVYSLVEVFPGFVAATADKLEDRICDALKLGSIEKCELVALDPLDKGMQLELLMLKFKYPKAIRVERNASIDCTPPANQDKIQNRAMRERDYLISVLPDEIDQIDQLGNYKVMIDQNAYKDRVCTAFHNPGF